jgi:hypothetical protein
MNNAFSQNEIKLFRAVGMPDKLIEAFQNNPIQIWKRVPIDFIINNIDGKLDHLLIPIRNGIVAIESMNPYRKTEEFDKLIEI